MFITKDSFTIHNLTILGNSQYSTSSIRSPPVYDILVKTISVKPFFRICEQIPNHDIYIIVRTHSNYPTVMSRAWLIWQIKKQLRI